MMYFSSLSSSNPFVPVTECGNAMKKPAGQPITSITKILTNTTYPMIIPFSLIHSLTI